MKDAIAQHLVSIAGQVAAALPPIIVMVAISRSAGLETAGAFAIAAAVSAAAFSTAQWGLRTTILLDRFEMAGPRVYLATRLAGLLAAAAVTAVLTAGLGLPGGLVAGLILYKACDGLVDLGFAVTQVRVDTRRAIQSFAALHTVKLGVLGVGLAFVGIFDISPGWAFAVSGGVVVASTGRHVVRRVAANSGSGQSAGTMITILVRSAPFALAVAVCSIVTSAPRFSLGWLYAGEMLGVAGVALSVATFFGMIFNTSWLRHLPRVAEPHRFRAAAVNYLAEMLIVVLLLLAAAWWVLPPFVGLLFAFAAEAQIALARDVLAAAVVFFAGMGLCNLFKVTRYPALESASYASALVIAGAALQYAAAFDEMQELLLLAGCTMACAGLLALVLPAQQQRHLVTDGRAES